VSLKAIRQIARLIVALTIVTVGLGLALLLESGVLLGVVIVLPFLAGM